jgi:hypothetical protein
MPAFDNGVAKAQRTTLLARHCGKPNWMSDPYVLSNRIREASVAGTLGEMKPKLSRLISETP